MKKLLVVLLVLAAVLVVVGLASPTDYAVSSSLVIDAPTSEVHAYVAELTRWPEWCPWEQEEDADITTTFGDKTTGVGAHQSWTSPEGDGELTFTTCDVDTGIIYDLIFINDDNRSPAEAAVTYRVVDGGTEVTMSMAGDWKGAVPPVVDGWMKIFSPLMLGGMFDDGLTKLKSVVEQDGSGGTAGA